MRQFTLKLRKGYDKPIIQFENFFGISALLDTGADFPVWIDDEKKLKEIGGVLVGSNIPFGGFGGRTTGNLYRINYFQLGDLIFPRMPIVAKKLDIPCQMILSAPMFNGLIYEIDNVNYKLNVTIPDGKSIVQDLVMHDKDGKLHVVSSDGDEEILQQK